MTELTLNQRVASRFATAAMALPALPGLGAPIYTHDMQVANPDAQMTRVVKDVLRVGRWYVGDNPDGTPRFWNVTPDTLAQMVGNFDAQLAAGILHPLRWGHGDPLWGVEDARDDICDISKLIIADNTLWMVGYVNMAQLRELQLTPRLVSVRERKDWTDGTGKTWAGSNLLHVAIAPHSRMPGQGGFIDMAIPPERQLNYLLKREGVTDMAFTLQPWVDAVNKLLPAGQQIPTKGDGAITPDNADETLALIMSFLGKDKQPQDQQPQDQNQPASTPAPATTTVPGPGGTAQPAVANSGQPTNMADNSAVLDLLKKQGEAIATLSKQFNDMQVGDLNAKKKAFEARLLQLGQAGLDAKICQAQLAAAAGHGYDMAVIEPLAELCDMAVFDDVSKRRRDPKAPSGVLDDETAKANGKALAAGNYR